jgi:hypothetical protein
MIWVVSPWNFTLKLNSYCGGFRGERMTPVSRAKRTSSHSPPPPHPALCKKTTIKIKLPSNWSVRGSMGEEQQKSSEIPMEHENPRQHHREKSKSPCFSHTVSSTQTGLEPRQTSLFQAGDPSVVMLPLKSTTQETPVALKVLSSQELPRVHMSVSLQSSSLWCIPPMLHHLICHLETGPVLPCVVLWGLIDTVRFHSFFFFLVWKGLNSGPHVC